MQRQILFLLMIVMAVGPAWGDASSAPPDHAIQAAGDTYDFGSRSVLDVSRIAHTFVLKAGAGAAVVVDRLQPSCHCTQAVAQGGVDGYGRFTIPAGGTARVDVTVNPSDMAPGAVDKEVYVFADGGSTPGVTLHVRGTITPPVAFSVPVLDFGLVPAGASRALSVTVTLDPRLPLSGGRGGLVCSDPRLQVTRLGAVPPSVVARTYRVTVPAMMPPGPFRATLSVSLPPQGPALDGAWSVAVRGEVAARTAKTGTASDGR